MIRASRREPGTRIRGSARSQDGGYHSDFQHGVIDYYSRIGPTYENPDEPHIAAALTHVVHRLDLRHVLDLACGSGEATRWVLASGGHSIIAADPYTAQAFAARNVRAIDANYVNFQTYSFERVAAGRLSKARFSTVLCTYAINLLPIEATLPFFTQMRKITDTFVAALPYWSPPTDVPHWRSEQIRVGKVYMCIYTAA